MIMIKFTAATITATLLWPSCASFDPCAPGSPLQVDPEVADACNEGDTGDETGGEGEPGELGLVGPMPTWVTPDYGFLDINHPPDGHQYQEIALEEQLFAYSCGGAAPGVNNCAIGIMGEETEYTSSLGIALCPNWVGGWGMPELDPGWNAIPGSAMTSPACEGLQGPSDGPIMVCSAVTCLGEIEGDPGVVGSHRHNYWMDCTCNCQTDADCPSPDGIELACELGVCLSGYASPPAPAGGPTVYGLSEWGSDLSCARGACSISAKLVHVIGHSAALAWDDLAADYDVASGTVTLTHVGVGSIADRLGLLAGDSANGSHLTSVLVGLLNREPTSLQVSRTDGSTVSMTFYVHE
jgi:hypothetical protein